MIMAKKTLATVIVEVLTAHGIPMTAAEVYAAISKGNLFEFNSKDPVGIVRSALSRLLKLRVCYPNPLRQRGIVLLRFMQCFGKSLADAF
jgi:hypothetical protein